MSKNAKMRNKAKARKNGKGGPTFEFNKSSMPTDQGKLAGYMADKGAAKKRARG
jgi:hypothetical protein